MSALHMHFNFLLTSLYPANAVNAPAKQRQAEASKFQAVTEAGEL